MSDYADEEMRAAQTALTDAEKMLRADVSSKAVITRLYYACFHAANAVLYREGFDPKTHQGTIRLFGREIVNAGKATGDDGRFLNDMRNYRQTADYTHDPLEADVEALFERTTMFIADLEALV